MLLVLSVSVFVISMIAALVMLIVGKNIPRKILIAFTVLHFILLFYSIFKYDEIRADPELLESGHIALLFSVCSGIILFGAWLRHHKALLLKLYFSLWIISLILFVRSPGRFFAFIYSGETQELTETSIEIIAPYFLSRQSTTPDENTRVYKVYMKKGLLTYTLRSGLEIQGEIKEISNVSLDEDSLRFYVVFENALTLDSIFWASPVSPKGKIEITKGTQHENN